jgi:hypothetical protein
LAATKRKSTRRALREGWKTERNIETSGGVKIVQLATEVS